ncbi:hypothetical protein BLNAU_11653 [Blattamonas nauphoetae]|uniref:Uncharacterized protein n=1 Tax=Blattamonas nauphoetae TaxID=2049346 RepID=A0ABQ9XLR9_9EUKA|nr:hypothetical protein BLNAU_11653 [Blattamonas nauphoetae]
MKKQIHPNAARKSVWRNFYRKYNTIVTQQKQTFGIIKRGLEELHDQVSSEVQVVIRSLYYLFKRGYHDSFEDKLKTSVYTERRALKRIKEHGFSIQHRIDNFGERSDAPKVSDIVDFFSYTMAITTPSSDDRSIRIGERPSHDKKQIRLDPTIEENDSIKQDEMSSDDSSDIYLYYSSCSDDSMEETRNSDTDFIPSRQLSVPTDTVVNGRQLEVLLDSIRDGSILHREADELQHILIANSFTFFTTHRISPIPLSQLIDDFLFFFPTSSLTKTRCYSYLKGCVTQSDNRTDMCGHCVLMNQLNALPAEKKAEFKTTLDLLHMHKEDAATQRAQHIADLTNLRDGECVLLGDFKENIAIPFGKVEVGDNFYTQSPITCLSFIGVKKTKGWTHKISQYQPELHTHLFRFEQFQYSLRFEVEDSEIQSASTSSSTESKRWGTEIKLETKQVDAKTKRSYAPIFTENKLGKEASLAATTLQERYQAVKPLTILFTAKVNKKVEGPI